MGSGTVGREVDKGGGWLWIIVTARSCACFVIIFMLDLPWLFLLVKFQRAEVYVQYIQYKQ